MSKLEDGYFYGDSSGNVRFVSYESLGGGGVFFALIILATIFLEKIGNYLISNQWIVLIPTLITVVFRHIMYDRELSTKHKICNIVSDSIRTIGIYGVLIALFSKVLECHILDRIFVALGLGLLFAGAYALINMACKFLRKNQLAVVHLILSIVVFLISLGIYLPQVADVEIKLFNSSAILGFTRLFSSSGFIIIALVAVVPLSIMIGKTIGKKINRNTQAKFDSIGNEIKKHLPNDAELYTVRYDGISYVDEYDETHSISFEELGYESFPVEKEMLTMHYMQNMGKWLLKNIVTDAKRYKIEVSTGSFGSGHVRLVTNEYIRSHTLKKWE